MKSLKNKIINMNPKKGFLNLLIVMIVFVIISCIGIGIKFGKRIPDIKQKIETMDKENENTCRQKNNNFKNDQKNDDKYNENDNEDDNECEEDREIDIEDVVSLSKSDYILLGTLAIIGYILLGIYWLYTAAYVVSKSCEIGANAILFGILTLFTNLFGVICFWIYVKLHGVCLKCGKLQHIKANNCYHCGTAIYVKCSDCGKRISVKDNYCSSCGRKMNKEKK